MILAMILGCGDPAHGPTDAPRTDPPPAASDVLAIPRADEVALRTWSGEEDGVGALAPLDAQGDLVVLGWDASAADDVSLVFSSSTASGELPSVAAVAPLVEPASSLSAWTDDDGDGRGEIWFDGALSSVRATWDGSAWDVLSRWDHLDTSVSIRSSADVTGDGLADVARGGDLVYSPLPATIGDGDLVPIGDGLAAALVGDFDGDGIGDAFATRSGLAVVDLADAPAVPFVPTEWVTDAPFAVDAGDVDGDGWRDVLVNDGQGDWGGPAWWSLVLGPVGPAGAAADLATATVVDAFSFVAAPVPVGDLDGDGNADLAIHQPDPWYGVVKLAYGPITGLVDGTDLPGWRGPTPYDEFGWQIAATELAGAPALAIAAPAWGHGGDGAEGGVFLLGP